MSGSSTWLARSLLTSYCSGGDFVEESGVFSSQVIAQPCSLDCMPDDRMWVLLPHPFLWLLVAQTTLLQRLRSEGKIPGDVQASDSFSLRSVCSYIAGSCGFLHQNLQTLRAILLILQVAEFRKDDPCIIADPPHWTEPSYAVPAWGLSIFLHWTSNFSTTFLLPRVKGFLSVFL